MGWFVLILAGCFEIGWPLGLKLAQLAEKGPQRLGGFALAAIAMGISGWLLYLAQRSIPLGTAYAVWTGIGATGTFVVGLLFFGDAATAGRLLGAAMIIGGVVVLRIAH